MERTSRFIWELQDGEQDTDLFKQTMAMLEQAVEQTADLSKSTAQEQRVSSSQALMNWTQGKNGFM